MNLSEYCDYLAGLTFDERVDLVNDSFSLIMEKFKEAVDLGIVSRQTLLTVVISLIKVAINVDEEITEEELRLINAALLPDDPMDYDRFKNGMAITDHDLEWYIEHTSAYFKGRFGPEIEKASANIVGCFLYLDGEKGAYKKNIMRRYAKYWMRREDLL